MCAPLLLSLPACTPAITHGWQSTLALSLSRSLSGRRRSPEPLPKYDVLPWSEPADFCYQPAWPRRAPGPPPIINPVQHSGKSEMMGSALQSNAINSRKAGPTSIGGGLKKMMSEGATRGQSEAKLLCEYASKKCQSELSLLLKSGADPNVLCKVDWQPFETTPLLEASVAGYKRLVRLLLEHGAKPNTVVGPGFTAIYNACMVSSHPPLFLHPPRSLHPRTPHLLPTRRYAEWAL